MVHTPVRRSNAAKVIGVLAAVGVCVAGMTTYSAFADENDEDSIFFATYEDGSTDSGYADIGQNECCTYSVQTAGFGRDSDTAVHHELRQGDPQEETHGARSESHSFDMESARFGVGDSYYYAFSVYIPSTWEYDGQAEDILFQWHTTPVGEPCEPRKSPAAFLEVHPANGGEWRLRVNSDENECTTADTIDKTHLGLGGVATGQWTDFVFKYDWAYDETGHIDVWTQTSKNPGWDHFEHDGPNTFNDPADVGYLKWGIYKPAWNNGGTSDVDKRAVFHDNIAMGTTCASVIPSGMETPCGDGAADDALPDTGPIDPVAFADQPQRRAWARRRS